MASYSIWGLHFLLSSMLLLAVASEKDPENCPGPEHCGYLGEIAFPFTKSFNPECGFRIKDCDQKIQLADHNWYIVFSILNTDLNNLSIFIHYPHSDAELPPAQPIKASEIINNITFFKCPTTYSTVPPCPSGISSHTLSSDSDYSICFCSPEHQVPNLPMSSLIPFASLLSLSNPPPTSQSCTFLFSVLQIILPSPCPNYDAPKPSPAPSAAPAPDHNMSKIIGLSIGIPSAVAFLALAVILLVYKRRNRYKDLKSKPTHAFSASFRNTRTRPSGAIYFGIPVFSYEELQEATNNFDDARVLGEGGFGTVYFGKLQDGREVAVKRLFERKYRPLESFINEIQILTRLRHKNLVSLYGCTSRHCRELLLVYEYIPNGTVSSHLHGDQPNPCLLPWHVRMKIAIETASALAYLHASDIIHRDVKTSNILLDNDFGVKVADFGLSRLFPEDATHVSTVPRGTPGYVDPDYRLCYQLTTKSDVYSFGVVLVELISSQKAVDMNRSRDDIKLANLAIRKIQRGAFSELIDPSLGFQSDEKLKKMVVSVAELAFRCLQGDKELRPSMIEVLEVLQMIQRGRDELDNLEGIEIHGTVRATQSYALPPLVRPQLRLHQTH
ncbi:hypothetical protein Fmac_001630 [Flemingia macrophylla]|uniref:Protein kinase domain-containing protein n=1 Tax=Flemingia macrophylla TaxID=520843 RepID=A0ABD1NKI5_9FABA